VSWAEFDAANPKLAEIGRLMFSRTRSGNGLMATVAGDQPPRIHPMTVAIVDGKLVTFVSRSAKRADLLADGRYALHAQIDEAAPSEFCVRGRAVPVTGEAARSLATAWYFETGDKYMPFELLVESVHYGERPDADAWPPRFQEWSAQ
jgi:hypothetical protein